MHLPLPIQRYFDADDRNDCEALLMAFAPDAVVTDEGRTHTGRQAIEAWWRDAKARAQHRNEPIAAVETGDTTEVRARVSGQFPGSPVTLTFAFLLKGGRIAGLEIRA
ncbi:nuclear transport factor 2 family protein [Roseomonas fluvialis]|uniref:SnoaL-like domain-containing protein n=1 Tax=Roseomonas fluvialis TaxID=1750527 RepID=A0ABM7Y8K0_9PROT|nr:nuclear transport factor 2 family protein [Roseomonas fluvialis]BDG74306.1 hypothetical protein Rmf_42350 [Roseomonas fluvialis]